MPRTPTTEIILTIQAVKQMQSDMTALAKVVEKIGERVVQLESRINGSNKE